MEKTVIRNEALNEQYYHFKHKSGLSVLLYPMKGYASAYALFGTNYGSIDTTFKTNKEAEFVTVPEGIAHFLEHKLFESEDGDAFTLFAKTGASANAFTSFDRTCYLFSATDNFEQSLDALVTFVQHPYFTKETVEKEQGIIGQEIRMYEDDPSWRVFFNLLGALYENNPVRIDIAGTSGSIAKIDKDLLYRCYNTFYNLNNMAIAIAGNFDADKAAALIESKLLDGEKLEVETKVPDEPKTVAEKEVEQSLSVAAPLFNIGYKELPANSDNELKLQLQSEVILEAAVGKASDLYKEMYDDSLINSTFYSEVFCGWGYFASIIGGESKNPKLVKEKTVAEIERIKKSGIDKATFNRIKKMMYGRAVMSFNDVEGVATEMISSHFSGRGIFDVVDAVKALTLEEVNNRLKTAFNAEYSAISVINPA